MFVLIESKNINLNFYGLVTKPSSHNCILINDLTNS